MLLNGVCVMTVMSVHSKPEFRFDKLEPKREYTFYNGSVVQLVRCELWSSHDILKELYNSILKMKRNQSWQQLLLFMVSAVKAGLHSNTTFIKGSQSSG